MLDKVYVETHRLILRQWKSSDEAPYIVLNQDKEVMRYFPTTHTKEESLLQIKRLSKHIDDYGYGFFAVERKDNHEFMGFTGLSHPRFESYFTPFVEIGWRLSKQNWGQGFATEAAMACLKLGFEEFDIPEIYSFTTVSNTPSARVMIKIGMIFQGYFEHPMLDDGDDLKTHILYKINKESV